MSTGPRLTRKQAEILAEHFDLYRTTMTAIDAGFLDRVSRLDLPASVAELIGDFMRTRNMANAATNVFVAAVMDGKGRDQAKGIARFQVDAEFSAPTGRAN